MCCLLIWEVVKVSFSTKQCLESYIEVAIDTHRCWRTYEDIITSGSKFYNAFNDNQIRMCQIYFIKFKSEVVDIFWKFKVWVETQSGCKIQVIRSDNGTKYTFEKLNKFCEDADMNTS